MNRVDRAVEKTVERLENITPYWFCPMFWGIEAIFAMVGSEWTFRLHWTTRVLFAFFVVAPSIVLWAITIPLAGALTLAIWAILLALAVVYAVVRPFLRGGK